MNNNGLLARGSGLSVSRLALASALLYAAVPAAVGAQGFQGTPISSNGATVANTGPNTTTVTVTNPTAVITWQPTDNATNPGVVIDFLPAGNTGIFQGTADYTILNRVLPSDTSRPIGLNGAIQSFINSQPGGNVWFYSPGGILVGSTATFDVGGLLLTANDVMLDTNGLFDPNNFRLVSNPDSTARVFTDVGSQINALNEGSYVLTVAPVLDIKGNTRVNGSAGYVTGEDVSISLNQGLFDITVNVGSSANGGTPLIFEGSTTGPASSGAGDFHRIYMVSVPKNDAITMFIAPTGDLGFDTATAATVEGDAIVLSAGRNITLGQIDANSGGLELPNNDIEANVHLHRGTFTSDVFARATSDVFAASLIGTPTFLQDITIQGGRKAHIGARISGETLMIGGNATVITDDIKNFTVTNPSVTREINATGGESLIYSESGATVQIMGSATVTADALPGDNNVTMTSGDAQGGQARIFTNGGAVNIVGNAVLSATAQQRGAASDGTGGQASVVADLGGTITFGGNLDISADGFGGTASFGANPAGNGTGGNADLGIGSGGGSISVTGSAILSAFGTGGSAIVSSSGAGIAGGTGQGGNAVIFISGSGNPSSLSFGGDVFMFGSGFGGSGGLGTTAGGNGGSGTAGSARINTNGGTATFAGFTDLEAVGGGGNGGDATDPAAADGDGGAGLGGRAEIASGGGGTLTFGDIELQAIGDGGFAGTNGTGGAGQGGVAALNAFGSDIFFGNAFLGADGFGGFGGVGGAGIGGFNTNTVENPNGGVDITAVDGDLVGTLLIASASGFGGDGSTGVGGDGFGGEIDSAAVNGATPSLFDVDTVTLIASGQGGFGGTGSDGNGAAGGSGSGGGIVMLAQTLNGNLDIESLFVDVSGVGGDGGAGADGGSGTGGAGGAGGSGTGGGAASIGSASGLGTGTPNGTVDLGSVFVSANGFGGAGGAGGAGATGGAGGAGGFASGGVAGLLARGGTLTASGVSLVADAFGGNGGAGGTPSAATGAGGNAFGGDAGATLTNRFQTTDPATVTIGVFSASAGSTGGTGSTNGSSFFGSTSVDVQGSSATFDSISLITGGDTPSISLITDPNDGSDVEVEVTNSSGLRVVSGTLNVTNDVLISTGSLGTIAAQGGAINVGGVLDLQAGEIVADLQIVEQRLDNGEVTVTVLPVQEGAPPATGPGTVDAGFLSLVSAGAINAPANFSAGDVSISAGGSIAMGGLSSDNDLIVVAADSLSFGNVSAGGDVGLVSTNGTLTTADVTAGGDLDLSANGDLVGGLLTGGGSVAAVSETGSVTLAGASAGLVNPTTDPETRLAVGIDAATGVTVTGTLEAAEDVGVVARAGNASLGDIKAGGSAVVLAGGDIATGAITASQAAGELVFLGDAANLPLLGPEFDPAGLLDNPGFTITNGTITVGGPVTAGQFTAITNGAFTAQSSIAAAQAILIDAAGVATFNGVAAGPAISVRSGDLDIGSAGGLAADALALEAIASTAGPVVIGGDGEGPAYTLDASEAFRIEARTISFDVEAIDDATPAQLLIRDITISGSLGDGTELVDVEVDGDIRVEGTIDYVDAASTDLLRLEADEGGRLEVITPSGGIRMTDDDNVSGILELEATMIVVADADLAAQLAADPNFEGRNQALRTNSGPVNPLGYVGAGAVSLVAAGEGSGTGGIFIQNTGGPTDFGGITVGEGGLSIRADSDDNAPIALVGFGRRRNDDGSTVGGSAFFGEVDFSTDPQDPEEDPTQYTADSEFNSCVIGGTSCGVVEELPDVSAQIAGVITESVIESAAESEAEEAEASGGTGGDARFFGIIETEGFDESSLIEEPVIGSGNVSLWQGGIADQMDDEECEEGEDAAACAAEAEEGDGQ